MRYEHTMQDLQSDCGIAVIHTMLKQIRKKNRDHSKIALELSNKGISMFDIIDTFERHGIESSAYEVDDLNELKKQKAPFIPVMVVDGLTHYIVVHNYHQKKNVFIVSDPSVPHIRQLPFDEFEQQFTGIALIVEAVNEAEPFEDETSKDLQLTSRIYGEVLKKIEKKYKVELSFLVILKFALPLLFFELLQRAISGNFEQMTVLNLILYGGFYLCFFVSSYYTGIRYMELQLKIENALQKKVIEDFYLLSATEANMKENINNVMGYLSTLMGSSVDLSSKFFLKIDTVISMFLVVYLFRLHYTFPIVYLIITFLYILYIRFSIKDITNYQKYLTQNSTAFFGIFERSILGAFDIKVFRKSWEAKDNLDDKVEKFFEAKYLQGLLQNKLSLLSNITTFAIIVSVIAITFISYIYFEESLYPLTAGMYVFFVIISSMERMAADYLSYKLSVVSMDYVQSIKNFAAVEQKEKENQTSIGKEIKTISSEALSFSYDEKKLLSNVKFKFSAGNIYIIKGKNGVGKTTFLYLLLGLLSPDSGEIAVNGCSYATLKDTDILSHLSFYSTEGFVFGGAAADNITMNVFTNKEGNRAYKSVFSKSLNRDSLVLDNGTNISQGQKQKLLLDRCFYQVDSSIYLLDEPTGNLDDWSKKELLSHMNQLKEEGKIIVVISHDTQLTAIADEVLFF